MRYYDKEIDIAVQALEQELEQSKPVEPTEPDEPESNYNYDSLIGAVLISILHGRGHIVSANRYTINTDGLVDDINVLVEVKYGSDFHTHYHLAGMVQSKDITIPDEFHDAVMAAFDAFNQEVKARKAYRKSIIQFCIDEIDYRSKTEKWNKVKEKRIDEEVSKIRVKREKKRTEEIAAKRKLIPQFDEKKHILYVYYGRQIRCKKNSHDIMSVTCILHSKENERVEINAEYCLDCKLFIISDHSYMDYALEYNLDISFFRPISLAFPDDYPYNANQTSALKDLGYNVSEQDGFSEAYRHKKLETIIRFGYMKKHRVIEYLEQFIRYNGEKWENMYAREKWENDLQFVRSLEIDVQPHTDISRVSNYTERNK